MRLAITAEGVLLTPSSAFARNVTSVTQEAEKLLVEHFNRLRGQMCGLIESFGLPERQERGCISSLKTLTYEAQKDIADLIARSSSS